MRPGNYQISAEKDLYQNFESALTVSQKNIQNFQFELLPLPGKLVLRGLPTETTVQTALDQRQSDRSGNVTLELPAGENEINLSHPRYFDLKERVEIEGKQKTQTLTVTMSPRWSEITVTTIPEGGKIFIDGEETAFNVPATLDVLEGERTVRVEKSGFRGAEKRFYSEAGTKQTVELPALKKADAKLELRTSPPGAAISVNGSFQGSAPLSLDLDSSIRHDVLIIYPGYASIERSIRIPKGEKKTLFENLELLTGTVIIETEQKDAIVAVNSEAVGFGTQTLELPLTEHDISISLEDHASFQTSLIPKMGIEQKIKVKLLTLEEARLASLKPSIKAAGGIDFLLLDARTLILGASRRVPGRRANEIEREAKFTRLFYIATKEVSNRQFRLFASGHDSGEYQSYGLDDDDQPAVNVSWDEAAAFCNWLSEQEEVQPFYEIEFGKVVGFKSKSKGYRLPSEAEWQWAASKTKDLAYDSDDQYKFSWGAKFPPPERFANFADRTAENIVARSIFGYNDNFIVSAPVGSFRPNRNGIYDLGGNVAEWTHDFYEIPGNQAISDHLGPQNGQYHVIKGSSWMHGTLTELRLAYRDYAIDGREDLGFRVARYAE
mgnify:FL=1